MVTANRRSIVTLDNVGYYLSVPKILLEYKGPEISLGDKRLNENVVYVEPLGWQLISSHDKPSDIHEGSAPAPQILQFTTPEDTPAGSGVFQKNTQSANTDLSGVTLGAGQQATGDPFWHKRIAAGDDWGVRFAPDEDSFGYPTNDESYVPLDRIGISDVNLSPNDKILLRFKAGHGDAGQALKDIIRICFVGVPGRTPVGNPAGTNEGSGHYALTLSGDGMAKLDEKLRDQSWANRKNWRWKSPHDVAGKWHYITIHSDARLTDKGWVGTCICFSYSNARDVGASLREIARNLKDDIAFALSQDRYVYRIPQSVITPAPTGPVRIDVRRDVRAPFQVSLPRYAPSGTLRTVMIDLKQPMGSNDPFQIEWYGTIPEGTSVSCKCFTKFGEQLDFDGAQTTYADGGVQRFLPEYHGVHTNERSLYAEFTLLSNDECTATPTINLVRFVRDPDVALGSPTPVTATWPMQIVEAISTTGPDANPAHESAMVRVHDMNGDLNRLKSRSGMNVLIEVAYDPDDATKTSVIHNGKVFSASRVRRARSRKHGLSGATVDFPSQDFGSYKISCTGHFYKLWKQQVPQRFDFSIDPNDANHRPFRIVDIIHDLIVGCGYPDHMVQVKEIGPSNSVPPTRYFPANGQSLIVEPFSQVGPLVVQLARDYLGAFLVFDPNATNTLAAGNDPTTKYGCWRLMIPPRPDVLTGKLNNLAQFVFQSNSTHTLSSPFDLAAMVDGTGTGGQVIKTVPVVGGSVTERVYQPEANEIIVTGFGFTPGDKDAADAAGSDRDQLHNDIHGINPPSHPLTQIVRNYKSALFTPDQVVAPDPTHPDYIDGDVWTLFYADPGLNSPNAVNFAARRLYDMACHAQKWINFEAPLVLVTNASDIHQTRPRPLRYGDGVLFNGEQFVVGSCNLDIDANKGGDRDQMAAYEIFSIPMIDNYTYAAGKTD